MLRTTFGVVCWVVYSVLTVATVVAWWWPR
jgi:hypothetical protein